MKLLSYNIHYGLGKDEHYDLARIADEVRDADIVALQEVERFWQRSGVVDQVAQIANLLPDFHWVYGANLDMDASFPDEDGRPVQRRRQFGNMILSRLPIISSRNHLLPKFGAVNLHTMQRGALETVIDLPVIGPVRIYATHLCHLTAGTRLPQVDHLLELHRNAPGEGGAWSGGHPEAQGGWAEGTMPPMPENAIMMGDFNFEPTDPEYEKFVGPFAKRYGRLVPLGGFVDSWVAAGNGEGVKGSPVGPSASITFSCPRRSPPMSPTPQSTMRPQGRIISPLSASLAGRCQNECLESVRLISRADSLSAACPHAL